MDYHRIRNIGWTFVLAPFLAACASIGSPSGGPKDMDPPMYIKSIPTPGELNFKKKKIEILFDEMISIKSPQEKIVISPPQTNMPIIKGAGKKVLIEIKDSIQEHTTYTIDFNDAIVDLNENNPLRGFALDFSTGNYIDSMQVAGTLIKAENQELVPNTIVGIQKQESDTAFMTKPLLRITKTDSKGHFIVRNIAPGTYKLFALNDKNRNYFYDQPVEEIAFYDSLIIPSCYPDVRPDTIWKDSTEIDTILIKPFTHYKPDSIILRLFGKKFARQYLVKSERLLSHKFSLYMAAPSDSLPQVEILNSPYKDSFLLQPNHTKDTLQYWITEASVWNLDTLQLAVKYLKTDSLNQLAWISDTLKLLDRNKKEKEKKKAALEKEQKKKGKKEILPIIELLGFEDNIASQFHIYNDIHITFNEPLAQIKKEQIRIKTMQDSIWKEIPYQLVQDTDNICTYKFQCQWTAGKEYSFEMDSASCVSIYGLCNDYYEKRFKIRALETYSKLTFYIEDLNKPAFIQLLDSKEKVLRQSSIINNKAEFLYLNPQEYYARLILDTNNNGVWDTGSYEDLQQPEEVIYFRKRLNIKINWELEEDWNIRELPLLQQKPEKIRTVKRFDKKKNNSTNKEENNNDEEDEENPFERVTNQ